MSKTSGFVLWSGHDRGPGPPGPFELRTEPGAGALRTRDYGIYSRPFRASAEALREKQPVLAGAALLAYTGQVADRELVARRLGRPELAQACDGTVLAAAYERWGAGFPARVDGEYAFALIDRRSGELAAGRDALGLKKAFWCRQGGRTWIASNLELLLAFLPEGARLDAAGIRECIAANLLSGASETTVFEGIRYLPPGQVLRFAGSESPRRTRYWRPETLPELGDVDGSTGAGQLRERLFVSVRQALRAEGPILAELSGGLDSSSIVGIAARLCRDAGSPDRLRTLSFVSADPDWDDPAHRRAVCTLHGLENLAFDADAPPGPEDLIGRAQPSLACLQSWSPRGHRWAAARTGARVCLNGQGGDVLFLKSEAPRFVADLWRQGEWRRWGRALRDWPDGRYGSLWDLLRFSVARSFAAPATVPGWLRGAGGAGRARAFEGRYGLPARQRMFETIAGLAAAIPDEAGRPLEPRSPLLARSVVELVLRLPWHHLTRPGEDRVIQRRALKDLVPETVLARRDKADFTAHAVRALRSLSRGGARAGGFRWLGDLGIVEVSAFTTAVDRYLHGLSTETMMHVSSALAVEAWLVANDGPPAFDLGPPGSLAAWAAGHDRVPHLPTDVSGDPHDRLDHDPGPRHRGALAGPRLPAPSFS